MLVNLADVRLSNKRLLDIPPEAGGTACTPPFGLRKERTRHFIQFTSSGTSKY